MRLTLKKLMKIQELEEIAKGKTGTLDISKLESDFLKLSECMTKRSLLVTPKRLYKLEGDERDHMRKVMEALGEPGDLPKSVDFSGAFDYRPFSDKLIIFSLEQALSADHLIDTRSYLNPILLKVYGDGKNMIRDFAINEALFGYVTITRGSLELKDVPFFPEKFTEGPYQLSVTIDSPNNSVMKYREIKEFLAQASKNPYILKDKEEMDKVANHAIALREVLGSLSRYDEVKDNAFQANTDSVVLRDESSILYYLHNDKGNFMVYFGENPFFDEPRNLTILNGEDFHHTLKTLIQNEFYVPSQPILEQRIRDLKQTFRDAARAKVITDPREHDEYKHLLEELEDTLDFFRGVRNGEGRKNYVMSKPPELAEFMVYPNTEDPVVHELLPRISWNSAVRHYNDTSGFIKSFEDSNDKKRKKMLQEVVSNITFINQQNNDVNSWLYANHKKTCEKAGLTFELR